MKPRAGRPPARVGERSGPRLKAGAGVLAGGALALVCCVGALGALGLGILGTVGTPRPSVAPGSTTNLAVGTAVGDLAPAFQLVDVDGRTVTRDSLNGAPALLWFTTSYCVPCQEGAVALKRVLAETGLEGRIRVVMVFVDPGEPTEALEAWKAQFGRPDWGYVLAPQAMITDYRVQYLDSKFLLDRGGIIRAADFLPLDEDAWAGHLRDVLAG